jgi:raffinose/stachyose/melibiose transport system substrate-binding protein
MKKRILALALGCALVLGLLASCGKKEEGSSSQAAGGGGTLYYLNFKPEVAEVYDEIAKAYKEETGVTLKVVTASSGTYEQTLKSEIAKSDAPVLFQINGPKGYLSWKNYCADLSNTQLYAHLTDKSLAVESGGKVYGIPYVVEGYGIIYNGAIMEKYFATQGAVVQSMDEIRSFDTLRAVVEDMTAKKEELGIQGVFASTSMKPGEDWRWHTHLANIPIYYEFQDREADLASDDVKEVEFRYQENFRNIFDLYLQNSVTDPKLLGSKQVSDSMAEFALGQCAMVQNGNWAWSQISQVEGNTVKEEDLGFLPIYTGMEGEENQGLCIGTENFLAINAKAPADQQKLAEEFIWWLYSSDTGKDFVVNRLGFIAPFDTFTQDEVPDDPLAREVMAYMQDPEAKNIPWVFTVFPNQTFKDNFGASLLQYAQGTKSWEDLTAQMKADWKAEA